MSEKGTRRWSRNRGLAVWAAACAAAPVVGRADSNYVGGAGVGSWSVATNWSPVGVPTAGANVNFLNADDLDRTLNYDYAGPAVTLGWLWVDQTGAGTNTLEISGGALTTSYVDVAVYGTGSIRQSGGTYSNGGVLIAYDAKSRGSYVLSGGELRAPNYEILGFYGSGEVVHSGGLNATGALFVGYDAGSTGTYRLSGSGRLEATTYESIGAQFNGSDTTGVFEHSGGTHVSDLLIIGGSNVGGGTYRLSGDGVLTVKTFDSLNANGRFEQTGGVHTTASFGMGGTPAAPAEYTMSAGEFRIGQNLTIGNSASGTSAAVATMSLSGGTASVTGRVMLGSAGGVLNVSGGTMTVAGTLTIDGKFGSGNAVLNLSGGSLAVAGGTTNNGTLNVTGGTFSTGPLVSTGTLHVGGGTAFAVAGSIVGNFGGTAVGRLVIDAGSSVVTNAVYQGDVVLNAPVANPPEPRAVVSIRPKAAGGVTSSVRTFTIAADAGGHPLGRVDLADTALVMDYYFAGQSPIGDVRSLIRSAWAGGTWTGGGLGSSAAAANPANMGLGYGEASAVVGPRGGVFEGMEVDNLAVVVKYTVLGDATLDGRVNFDDLLALARHYNATDASWADGDFGYDGVVNFDDLLVLAKHYNTVMPAAGSAFPGGPAGFGADVAAAFAQAAVPEPGAVGVVAGVAAALATRRRRRGVAGGDKAGGNLAS